MDAISGIILVMRPYPKELRSRVVAAVERAATPLEAVLADPAALLGQRERLSALIDGLTRSGRRTDVYRKKLAESRGSD